MAKRDERFPKPRRLHQNKRSGGKMHLLQPDLLPEDYIPACVQACPSGAMYFGDLNDPNSIVSMLSRERRAFRLMEELGTKPKVIYLSEGM
jgi:Fe-S-cluster-containing dehydrogenase component